MTPKFESLDSCSFIAVVAILQNWPERTFVAYVSRRIDDRKERFRCTALLKEPFSRLYRVPYEA